MFRDFLLSNRAIQKCILTFALIFPLLLSSCLRVTLSSAPIERGGEDGVSYAPLHISPSSGYVGVTREQIIEVTGGKPPYSYQIVSGDGAVAPDSPNAGAYTAPAAILGNSVVETIRVTDALGDSALASFTVAVPGTLDTSFGTAGKTTVDFSNLADVGRRIMLQSDGKPLSIGYVNNGSQTAFGIARYTTSGALDASFGTGGKATIAVGSADFAFGAVQQPDGKIVVGGYATNVPNGYDFAAIRLNADGTLDTGFGTAGKTIVTLGSGADRAFAIGLQSDGKIILAGDSSIAGNIDMALVRLTSSGALDTTFGTAGILTFPVGVATDSIKGMSIQPDDKIVVAGFAASDSVIARLTKDGALDPSFNSTGIFTQSFDAGSDGFEAVIVQKDGKIAASGSTPADYLIARLNDDGTLDTTFNASGYLIAPVGAAADLSYGLIQLRDGSLFANGYSHNGANNDFSACRITSTGALDATFNGSGRLLVPVGAGADQSYGAVEDSLGRVLMGGYSANANNDYAIIRLWP